MAGTSPAMTEFIRAFLTFLFVQPLESDATAHKRKMPGLVSRAFGIFQETRRLAELVHRVVSAAGL